MKSDSVSPSHHSGASCAAAAAAFFENSSETNERMPNATPKPLTESDARQISWAFRQKFRNTEVFEAAWERLFALQSAITADLARRFLTEELLKYRAHAAGLELPPSEPAPPSAIHAPRLYECPGCHRQLEQWSRDGHADDCPHIHCYELEVRFREGKRHLASRTDG
jgi:hypothetical protein